jgi:hypothetical protein
MKYRFEILYQPPHYKKACELMRKMDFPDFEAGIMEVMTFTADDIDVKHVKASIIAAFNESNLTVLNIEGGKVE